MRLATFPCLPLVSGISGIPYLKVFLDADDVIVSPTSRQSADLDLVVGWGRKQNTARAIQFSKRHGIPYASLEDGFLRSVGLGRAGKYSISLVVDKTGIHYDAGQPSYLEELLNGSDDVFTPSLMQTADQAISFILKHKISKYNGAPDMPADQCSSSKKNVLIVDQVAGDASIIYGASTFSLDKMITAAKDENPDADIYVKLHPENIQGFRKSLFSGYTEDARIQFITEDFNPLSVLEAMDKVYVATSQMGFEALLLGKEVVCFGIPFYAGWGLTDDREKCARRIKKRSVKEVFVAAYMLYSRYVNPITGKRCEILEALEYLELQTRMERLNSPDIYCFGIRHWTRVNIKPFLSSSHNKVVFVKSVSAAKKAGIKLDDQVVIWGTRKPSGLDELIGITQKPPISMEDGFLRSVGLGSDFVRPSSLVLDSEGIYFDPSKPSHLESLLLNTKFSPTVLHQAIRVREKIIQARLTKYNHEPHQEVEISAPEGRKTILAPGQVEDDASIKLGCESVNTNLGLLRAIRERHPEAYIIYKPHPDVSSGNRNGKVTNGDALNFCDQVIDNVSIAACLDKIDAVHTMTSLVGFEALMRKIPVTVYGRPFYSGWGLTEDLLPIPRRTKGLSLDELVAGALLLYPRYYDWESNSYTDCEGIIDKLISDREKATKKKGLGRLQVSYIERQAKKLGMLIKGIAHA